MAFSTRRGRPPKPPVEPHDCGTPELRLKHALGLTAEPIDLCLERALITQAQHRAGLHLRWLYTLRYGAPSLTTRYMLKEGRTVEDDADWRHQREREYLEATRLLKAHQRYEPVMRLAIFNERPLYLSSALRQQTLRDAKLAHAALSALETVTDGLELLISLWAPAKAQQASATPHSEPIQWM